MTVQELERPQREGNAAQPQKSPVPKPVIAFFAVVRKLMGRAEDERESVYEPDAQSHIGTWNIRVSLSPDETDGGFVAESPDIPGAVSQGETQEEALENLIDAIQGVVAAKLEENFRAIDIDALPDALHFSVKL